MQQSKKSNKPIIIVAGLLVVLAVVFGLIYALNRPSGTQGAKHVTIEIVAQDEKSEIKEISTDEEFLGPMLVKEGLAEGETGEFGLFIHTVNGIKADDTQQQWWCVTKDGADVMTGVDETAIADGEKYELTLKTGY